MKKYENFCKTLKNLQLVRTIEEPFDEFQQSGSAKMFELCFEQSWKLMKELLEFHGRTEQKTGSPRMIIKTAYQCGMISDETGWLAVLEARNRLAHIYDDEDSLEFIRKIKSQYLPLFEALKTEIDENWITEM